jgi:hypothetical protein
VDVVSDGEFIDCGALIVVSRVDGNRIFVRRHHVSAERVKKILGFEIAGGFAKAPSRTPFYRRALLENQRDVRRRFIMMTLLGPCRTFDPPN